jgi:Gram-negative bacterial TonB protein C-terminal
MRRILIASLFASTVLLHAQTAPEGQGVTLEASSSAPNALAAPALANPASAADAAIPRRRVSTGVIQPHLLSNPVANLTWADFNATNPSDQHMVVHVELDTKGIPQRVQVVKPVNPRVDSQILDAVSGYRFSPGMVDGVPVPSDLDLMIDFNLQ